MIFLSDINIDVYDRTNIVQIYNSLNLQITDLENKLNSCGHYGYSKEEIKLLEEKKRLNNKLDELSIIMNDKSIALYDELIQKELELPNNRGRLVGLEEIYETREIYSNHKVLVYKNKLIK